MKWFNYNSVFEPPTMDHVNCPKYWWRNILYINTLFPVEEMVSFYFITYADEELKKYVVVHALELVFVGRYAVLRRGGCFVNSGNKVRLIIYGGGKMVCSL